MPLQWLCDVINRPRESTSGMGAEPVPKSGFADEKGLAGGEIAQTEYAFIQLVVPFESLTGNHLLHEDFRFDKPSVPIDRVWLRL